MGSLAEVAKMMPGAAGKIDANQLRTADTHMKKNGSMINSMTKSEHRRPDLLISDVTSDVTSRSRQKRAAKGAGLKTEDAAQFMSEFQKMRTMMSRMSKMMGPGGAPGGMDPAMEGADMDVSEMRGANRALRPQKLEKEEWQRRRRRFWMSTCA
jgi:signal recognition particle GTPase